MGRFAERTKVSPEKSKAEIEATLRRYKADEVLTGTAGDGRVLLGFVLQGRSVRIVEQMPQRKEFRSDAAHDQAVRQRWRALLLWIKAQLEWIDTSGKPVEEVFFQHLVMPNGQTLLESELPKLQQAYATGQMPRLLPDLRKP